MLLFFLIAAADMRLESQLKTPSGLIERSSSKKDEREFSVKLTREDGSIEWLELPAEKNFSTDERVLRNSFAGSNESVMTESFGRKNLIGIAPRIFESEGSADEDSCEAIARINFPTPLSSFADLLISNLKCANKIPQTETATLNVLGKENKSWTICDANQASCLWNSEFLKQPEATVQASVLGFLWTAQKELALLHLNPEMKSLTAKSWAAYSDKSTYDATKRTLFYGAGNFLDGRDGFVVVHEWAHALIDDLNPGLWGAEALVIHEAVADFMAAETFDSPCFAPYDAREVPNRKCVRNLVNNKKYPEDLHGEPHEDSLFLSGALWEARNILPPGTTVEPILETIIRLPKNPSLQMFWKKFTEVYTRLKTERPNLGEHLTELSEIESRRLND
ncbi:MAG: hypothetical protein JWQ35_1727 [Bacteriovoracaceae bacterium]|nr:hypothetical protein [Bacteriovoracaceae bacterium]